MNKQDKLYIILINYNSYNYTVDCVKSLKNSTIQNFRIIILDNNSGDNSGKQLADKYSDDPIVDIILSKENTGFAGGNNYAIKQALCQGADSILLLNNDTEVKENFLDTLLSGWNKDTVRTPRINYFDDKTTVWYANGKFSKLMVITYNRYPHKNSFVNFASGCCMLLSKDIIEKVGFFDEKFFMYYEDVDYCLRMKNAGIKIEYIANAVIYHKCGRSSGGERSVLSIYYANRNRFYIIKKYKFGFFCWIYTLATRIIRIIAAPVNGNKDLIILDAWRDFRKGFMGKNPKC